MHATWRETTDPPPTPQMPPVVSGNRGHFSHQKAPKSVKNHGRNRAFVTVNECIFGPFSGFRVPYPRTVCFGLFSYKIIVNLQ